MKLKAFYLLSLAWMMACVPITSTPIVVGPTPTAQGYPAPETATAVVPTENYLAPVTETVVPSTETSQPPPFAGAQLISAENIDSLRLLTQFHQNYTVYDLAWSPSSHNIAFISSLGLFVYNLDTDENRQLTDATLYNPRAELAFNSDGKLLALSIVGLETRLFNVETGSLFRTFIDEEGESVAFHPDGRNLILTSGPELNLWDIETGELLRTFSVPGMNRKLRQVAFAPNSELIAASTTGGGLFVWDSNSGSIKFQTTVSLFLARQLVFSPNSQFLAIGDSSAPGLQLWSINSGQMILGVNTRAVVNGAAFTYDGQVVANAGGAPNTIEFWRIENGESIFKIELANREFDDDFVSDIAFSPDGRLFASAGGAGSGLMVWAVVKP